MGNFIVRFGVIFILGLTVFLGLNVMGFAADYGAKIQSSHSESATAGPVMFTSAPFQGVAVTISSPAPGGMIVIHRSTSPTFNALIATQTKVNCGWPNAHGPETVLLHEIENTSYTFVNRVGNCVATIFYR